MSASRRPSCPSGKTGCYPDQDTAIAAAIRVSFRLGRPMRCYLCPSCDRWHITRRATWTQR